MTKAYFALLVMGLMTIASCKKSPDPGGYWAFQGITYYVAGCEVGGTNSLNASNVNNNNYYTYGTLGVNFSILPDTAGTYTVVRFPPAAHQVSITAGIDGYTPINYSSTGGNGTETVKVTVAKNGFVTVAGSGIMMLNASGGTDSSALSLDITQTQ